MYTLNLTFDGIKLMEKYLFKNIVIISLWFIYVLYYICQELSKQFIQKFCLMSISLKIMKILGNRKISIISWQYFDNFTKYLHNLIICFAVHLVWGVFI